MEQTVYNGCIGLGATHEETHQRIRAAASLTYQIGCTAGVIILTVTNSLFKIGLNKPLHHHRMSALHIIRIKVEHILQFINANVVNIRFKK